MASLMEAFNAGAANAWVFVPSAVLLGALHGLEPGHSKTMMAAFIIAIRGTVAQAALLGLSATISHTAIVWIVAMAGLSFGAQWSGEASEPYLQLASGALIIGVALWMMWRTWRENAGHGHGRPHAHHHHHDDERDDDAREHHHGHQGHHHRNFGHHRHDHAHGPAHAAAARQEAVFEHDLMLIDPEACADEHEREHAVEINRRFANRNVTTGQIVLFGLTGGLIPCPASITVLLLCLQVGKFGLGAALVLSFSVGLALTMVAVGAAAALGVRHVSTRWTGFETLAARAPYLSSAIVSLVGIYTIYLAASALA